MLFFFSFLIIKENYKLIILWNNCYIDRCKCIIAVSQLTHQATFIKVLGNQSTIHLSSAIYLLHRMFRYNR